MTPEIKLHLAESIIKCVFECSYCPSCKQLAAEYYSTVEYWIQLDKEDNEETA